MGKSGGPGESELTPPQPPGSGHGPTGGKGSERPPAGASSSGGGLVPARGSKQIARSGYGSRGKQVQLACNHFAVRLMGVQDVYHYNVTIEPAVPKKTSRRVMNKFRATYGAVELQGKQGAFDGEKSLFTVGALNSHNQDYQVYLDDERGPTFRPGARRSPGERPQAGSPPAGSPVPMEVAPKRRRTIERGREFLVRIEFAARVDMRSIEALLRGEGGPDAERGQDALRVLDVVLKEMASARGYLVVRDNFYHPSLGRMENLGEGVEAWRGFHSSIRPTKMGLTLNLDITMTTILKPLPVNELLEERFGKPLGRFNPNDWNKAKSLLRNIRVETTHMKISRTHKIRSLSSTPCGQLKFTKKVKDDQGNALPDVEVSVEEYYFDVYRHRLQYPQLPALDVGNTRKPAYIPLELCKILEGQRYTKSLSRTQRQRQIDACKQTPQERRRECENAMQANEYHSDNLIKEFGLQFSPDLARVNGRILDAPSLSFGKGRIETPRDGRWNFTDKVMLKGCEVPTWAVVNFNMQCRDVDDIARRLCQCCNRRGMFNMIRSGIPGWDSQDVYRTTMKDPDFVGNAPQGGSPEDCVQRVFDLLQSVRPSFILAILPEKESDFYGPFKRMCEVRYRVASQCMVKPRQLNDQYLGNLALKINLKLGGYNSTLTPEMTKFLGKPTIIFGMDVSHGSPGDADSPSIAAVVASKNWPRVSGMYASQVRTQAPKLEMIEGLYENSEESIGMVRELLKEFYRTCEGGPRKPEQIIIYRDGVSESQFDKCLEVEVAAFIEACNALESGYRPGITLLVAQKRHNTRFFPIPPGPSLPKGNVIPGTVVDKDICHPRTNDFFLCSHAAIGTTRPTHYHVLINENNFTVDDLQQLTNNLCYTFSRCTTAIGVAAPAAYAHLVATRARKLLDSGADRSSLSQSHGGEGPRPVPKLPPIKLGGDTSMFFC